MSYLKADTIKACSFVCRRLLKFYVLLRVISPLKAYHDVLAYHFSKYLFKRP